MLVEEKPNLKEINQPAEIVGAVMVVGGGIAGIQTALELAGSGFKVYLVESSSVLGGQMAQLDKTFPTNDCSMCILSPKLIECGKHPDIEVITLAQVLSISGKPGKFTVRLLKSPRYVDETKCTGCGICQEKCPYYSDNEYNMGLDRRKAIYIPFAQAIPNMPVIDSESCAYFLKGRCRACERFCPSGAINFAQKPEERDIVVGAVVLCPGSEVLAPTLNPEYGYGRMANVITSMEYERMLSASGPTRGEILCPATGKPPERIAWLQCVGSRDVSSGHGYCSAVCCMYAIKQASMTLEHVPQAKITIFHNDIRTFGKGFEEQYQAAQHTTGITFVRSIVSSVKELHQTKKLRINYLDGHSKEEEDFDMVVLSTGLGPPAQGVELAKRLGVEVGPYGFCQSSVFSPVVTSRPGVYVAGSFSAPMDIPQSVMTATASAAMVESLLSSRRASMVTSKEYPPEREVGREEPRVGVFVCRCGTNIARVVDVALVTSYARDLPHVAYAEENLFTCSVDTTRRMADIIRKEKLNRIVVASCSPRTHETLFQNVLRETGINHYLLEMANIRDQCSWVHMDYPEEATAKAKDLVRMAVAKAVQGRPLPEVELKVLPRALVIGGGLAGMTASLRLAEQGFDVDLIEKMGRLGGNLNHLASTLEGEEIVPYLASLIKEVQRHPLIHIHLDSELVDIRGAVGNFQTTIGCHGNATTTLQINHGVTIIATGAEEYKPDEYCYGYTSHVITQQELEEQFINDPAVIGRMNSFAMIQCVGSRDERRRYCSRVCCAQAVKNALRIKKLNPAASVAIFYRDMRTYGLKEDYYRLAREMGVLFIHYEPEAKPELLVDENGLHLRALDPILHTEISLNPELVVLSTGVVPAESRVLSSLIKVPVDPNGFFLEAHIKLRPVDFATDGIFLCGLAHSPKTIDETIVQASAAAARAASVLSRGTFIAPGTVAYVDRSACSGCKRCLGVCPYGAITFDSMKVAVIEPSRCKGCGNCAANCPSGACQIAGFEDKQIMAQLESLLTA